MPGNASRFSGRGRVGRGVRIVVLATVVSAVVTPAFAAICTMQEGALQSQEILKLMAALESKNPTKAKEVEAKVTPIMEEDSQPPNDSDSARLCADGDKIIEMLKAADQ